MSETQRGSRTGFVAWLAMAVLATTPWWASSASAAAEISTEIPELSSEIGVAVVDGRLELSLEQAIEITLQRNLGLIVQRYNDVESRLNLDQSFGIYDVVATAELSGFDETSPSASNLDGAEVNTSESQTWNFGLSQLVKTGGTVSLDFNNRRSETNSFFSTLNPSFRTDFDLSFRQPLLKDMGQQFTELNIQVARTNREISRETFSQQVSTVIQQVVNAYWNLVGTRNLLGVSERSLDLAQQLHEQNKIRVDVGTLAPLELVQSEAGIATRDEEIIRARASVADAEDTLRQLLNLDRRSLWDVELATTSPAESERRKVAIDAAIEQALASRPEMASLLLGLENYQLDVDYYRNQQLPQLDLTARYGLNGLGGDVTERDFLTGEILFEESGDYGDALDQITEASFAGWSVGLNLTYPLQNRSAEAQFTKAEISLERATAEVRDLELQIITEVRKAVRGLETAAQQIDSARVSRRLQQRTLEAEQKRYDNGMSTSYRVLEIQRDLIDAAYREVFAVTSYRTALAEYQRSTGVLNEESGVTIVDIGD